MAVLARDAQRIGNLLGRAALGEYVDRIDVGGAGVLAPYGVHVPPGRVGLVCSTPPTFLPVGSYRASALLEGYGGQPLAARATLGEIEVLADQMGRVLARAPLNEVTELAFAVTAEAAASTIQLRIQAREGGFTVLSLGLHRAAASETAPALPAEASLPTLPDSVPPVPGDNTAVKAPTTDVPSKLRAAHASMHAAAFRRLRRALAGALRRIGVLQRFQRFKLFPDGH